MSTPILDVDLLAFERGDADARRAVVDGVMRSLKTGFVYLAHDLSEALLDEAYAKLEAFFALPDDVKRSCVVDGSHGQRGYTGLLVETAASAEHADWKEMWNQGNSVPEGHPLRSRYAHRYAGNRYPDEHVPGFGQVMTAFHDSLHALQTRFLRIVALGIGCHESFFDTMMTDGATLSRAIHYPAMDLAPGAEHVWAAAHGDINLTTALPRATARGLQVETEAGWIDAAPPDGHAILNTGIMLEHVTNGLIPQGIHRVVAEEGQQGDRMSVVQFAHPTPWTVLSPVASTISPERPQRFAPIAAADLLDQVLYDINLVEDARRG